MKSEENRHVEQVFCVGITLNINICKLNHQVLPSFKFSFPKAQKMSHQQQPHVAGRRPSSASRRSTPTKQEYYVSANNDQEKYQHQDEYDVDPNYSYNNNNINDVDYDEYVRNHEYQQEQQQKQKQWSNQSSRRNSGSYAVQEQQTRQQPQNHQSNAATTQQQQQKQPVHQKRYAVDPALAKLEEELYTERMQRDDLEKRVIMFEEQEAAQRLEDEEAHQRRILEMFVTAALIKEDRKQVFKQQLQSLEALSHPSVVEQLEKVAKHIQVERSVVDALSKQQEAKMHAIRVDAAKEREKYGFYRTMLIRRMRQLEEHCKMVCGTDHWLLRLAPNLAADGDRPFNSVSGLKIQQTPAARNFYQQQQQQQGSEYHGDHHVDNEDGDRVGGGVGPSSSISPSLLQYPTNAVGGVDGRRYSHQNQNRQLLDQVGYQMSGPAGDFATKVLLGSVSPAPQQTE